MSHRFLHWRVIYPYFHKIHHEFKVTLSFAAEYAHPLDYLVSSLIPSSIGCNILGPKLHFYSLLCWYVIRITETADGHSGYDFPWSPFRLIPFTNSPSYHDFHHLKNVGNYKTNRRTWDSIFGCN
jgi:methylsterol monooxygenase/4-alpha-methyl-delta7-sterol-4alpha-methyl oxidase